MLKLLAVVVVLICLGAVTDGSSLVVRREQREWIAKTEYGTISGVEIKDGIKGPYHLQFLTLDPNSIFLPVLLHADMVFYVQSGSGSLSWSDEDGTNQIDVSKGDIYRIPSGSVFFVKSNLEDERERLRICSIFTNPDNLEHSQELDSGPYSTMPDLITGFDTKVLQAAFQVSEEVIDSIRNTTKSPPIVHVPSTNKTDHTNWTDRILDILTGGGLDGISNKNKKKKKTKIFNILNTKPDFQNCNGWSKTVNKKDLKALKGSNIGVFMVNLTEGSMMGPHWNPRASEIAIVLQGQGMVHMVCSSMMNVSECKNRRFKVKEGDVFAVPRFHPMVQMAYDNETFVFMGFSTMAKHNYPQFLAGKSSVLQTLDKDVLAMSFNVSNATVTKLLSSQGESVILGCVSCAEEEEMRMQQEIEKERQEEEARKKKEEEERKREEEEARKKREEEEARKKREEEERKRQEEEEEEEERKRQEEEARKKEEEEEKRREEEEERKRREEEEERKRQEEAARKKEEEEEKRREEEEAAQREAEKEAAEEERRREEEEERKREEEEAAQKEAEKEEAQRKREQEEQRKEEAEEQRKQEEEEQRKEEAEAQRKQEEEEQRREEAARQEQEEAARQEQEEAARQEQEREEAEAARQEQEEAARQEQEEAARQEQEREEAERQGEEQGRGEEARRGRKEGRREGGGGGLRKIFIF